ncbi:hypothetical protein XELAEV_18020878mg [Xenopus laevis]|uniref:Uncharacterized protein n=1 Tax=Xenopus laevis TaxID=8355 RepID=A0A974HQV5_XENLA|nr:hypothetical protein XELAEV_18020878mg [Xenopus laevis]
MDNPTSGKRGKARAELPPSNHLSIQFPEHCVIMIPKDLTVSVSFIHLQRQSCNNTLQVWHYSRLDKEENNLWHK